MSISSSVLLFWGAIVAGYAARRLHWVRPTFAAQFTRWLSSWIAPPVVLLSMWVLDWRHLAVASLPFVGILVAAASLGLAWWLARRWRLRGPQCGSWLVAACFSNVGYLGALVAFTAWGEVAYGLCTLYFLFFGLTVYTVGYALGGRYGAPPTPAAVARRPLELWRWAPLAGMAIGWALSWWSVPRPAMLGPLNHALIPIMTVTYIATVSTTLRLSHVRRHLRPGLWMSVIKLVVAPLIGAGLAWALGYHRVHDGLLFRVTVLESAMPSAIASLTLPALFHLDQDLANSLWIITTLASMLIIPLLLWLL